MPRILEIKGFRFFFYSADGNEPPHVHVQRGSGDGKIWLEPEVEEEYLEDFKNQEKREIRKIVEDKREYLIKKWNEYFAKST